MRNVCASRKINIFPAIGFWYNIEMEVLMNLEKTGNLFLEMCFFDFWIFSRQNFQCRNKDLNITFLRPFCPLTWSFWTLKILTKNCDESLSILELLLFFQILNFTLVFRFHISVLDFRNSKKFFLIFRARNMKYKSVLNRASNLPLQHTRISFKLSYKKQKTFLGEEKVLRANNISKQKFMGLDL